MVLHVGWTACRVFPCHFAVSISRLIFVQVSPPCSDSKRGELFARTGRKSFYSKLQCEFIQSVNFGERFAPPATVCSEPSVNNGPRWNAWVLQCAVLRQLIGRVWKIWSSFNLRLPGCRWIGPSRIVGQYVSKSTYSKWKFVLKWWLL